MKTLPVLLAMGVLIAGCGQAPVVKATEGGRAQKLASAPQMQNDFVGVWSSPPTGQTTNEWIVIFTSDGLIAVDGPGLKADGTYHTDGPTALAKFEMTNGREPRNDTMARGEFALIDGQQMMFATGVPGQPPVQLTRAMAGIAAEPKPGLAQPASDAPINPLTLASLSL